MRKLREMAPSSQITFSGSLQESGAWRNKNFSNSGIQLRIHILKLLLVVNL